MNSVDEVLGLARPSLRTLKPYSSARDEFDQSEAGSELVYLDANESPYPTAYNRYPDPHQRQLKKAISKVKDYPVEGIFVGNGSDEAIDLIIRTFCVSNKHNVVIPSPTYGMYSVSAAINDVAVKQVSLTKDFNLDVESVFKTIDNQTRIIFLCSPNNPTGNQLSPTAIMETVEKFNGVVVVDEAYIDFTDGPGLLGRLDKYPNLIVLQTLSKAWGLAGLRLGMAFGHPRIVALLDKIKPPYNISSLAQELAIDALNNVQEKNRRVSEILRERDSVSTSLVALKSVREVHKSAANFLLVRINDAPRAYRHLVTTGIVVRDRSQVTLCKDCLRITIGTPLENDQLLKALATYE